VTRSCPSCGLLTCENTVCAECASGFAETLRAAPELFVSAHLDLAPSLTQAPSPIGRVSGGAGPGSRPPVNAALLSSADLFARVLGAWELHTLSLLALSTDDRRVRVGRLVQRAAHTIGCHLDVATSSAAGVAYALSAQRAALALRERLGQVESHSRLVDPCPQCDRRGLTCANETRIITCGLCGSQWTDAQYHTAISAMSGT
jgi:ribosomal protein L37AE/L43A